MGRFSVGQKVRVVDSGKVYSTYYDWATDNKFSFSDCKIRELWAKYLTTKNNSCKKGTELTIIATGCHGDDRCIDMYLCEDPKGNPVLICEQGLEQGLEPVEEGLKWTDLKIGDVIKQKVHGYQLMVIGMDSSPDVSNHVYVAFDWIDDSELSDYWEKVEE